MRKATSRRLLGWLVLVLIQTLSYPSVEAGPLIPSSHQVRLAQANGGILKVYSNQKGARVLINDQEVGQAPVVKMLPPGKYRVRVEAPGYTTYQNELQVLTNKTVTVQAPLVRVVGAIDVQANVPGARVLLDGREVAMTPAAVIDEVPAGTYLLQVQKPGYTPYSGPVTVKPGVRLKVKIDLIAGAAMVNLTSTPSGATVYLDGKLVGQTPYTLESVEPGRHALRFELPGYATYFRVLQADVGETLDLEIPFSKDSGSLRVKTSVPGTDVYLDGNLIGTTPLLIRDQIQPGQYSLRLSQPGFADLVQPVVVEKGRVTRVSASLVALSGVDYQKAPVGRPTQTASAAPLTRKWWFWTIVGGVALGAAGGTAAAVAGGSSGTTAQTVGDVVVTLP